MQAVGFQHQATFSLNNIVNIQRSNDTSHMCVAAMRCENVLSCVHNSHSEKVECGFQLDTMLAVLAWSFSTKLTTQINFTLSIS